MECRTPRELENEVGLTEGNIFQGELTMDQLLFNRPFPGYAQYRGPVKGFYMTSGAGRLRRVPRASVSRHASSSMANSWMPRKVGDSRL